MMKKIFIFLLMLLFHVNLHAQQAGGVIKRPSHNTGNNISKKSKYTDKPEVSYNNYSIEEQYERGKSCYERNNYKEAVSWYKKAAYKGSLDAQRELGLMYYNGYGVAVDKETAANWFLKAGEKGDAIAQYMLGEMFKKGYGVTYSKSESKKWYNKAVPTLYEAAKKMYLWQDKKCVETYEKIIEADVLPYSVWSMFHIGAIYYYGEGGMKQNYSEAYRYFRFAADCGNKPALYYLGLCKEYGRGTQQNSSLAKEYYNKSGYTTLPPRNF